MISPHPAVVSGEARSTQVKRWPLAHTQRAPAATPPLPTTPDHIAASERVAEADSLTWASALLRCHTGLCRPDQERHDHDRQRARIGARTRPRRRRCRMCMRRERLQRSCKCRCCAHCSTLLRFSGAAQICVNQHQNVTSSIVTEHGTVRGLPVRSSPRRVDASTHERARCVRPCSSCAIMLCHIAVPRGTHVPVPLP